MNGLMRTSWDQLHTATGKLSKRTLREQFRDYAPPEGAGADGN